jgi:hypothetical protein
MGVKTFNFNKKSYHCLNSGKKYKINQIDLLFKVYKYMKYGNLDEFQVEYDRGLKLIKKNEDFFKIEVNNHNELFSLNYKESFTCLNGATNFFIDLKNEHFSFKIFKSLFKAPGAFKYNENN